MVNIVRKMVVNVDYDKFLLKVKEYIEYAEDTIEHEWGSNRSIEQLIKEGDMPSIYNEVVSRINNK